MNSRYFHRKKSDFFWKLTYVQKNIYTEVCKSRYTVRIIPALSVYSVQYVLCARCVFHYCIISFASPYTGLELATLEHSWWRWQACLWISVTFINIYIFPPTLNCQSSIIIYIVYLFIHIYLLLKYIQWFDVIKVS